jgi:Protein of unknown function (DUF4232)
MATVLCGGLIAAACSSNKPHTSTTTTTLQHSTTTTGVVPTTASTTSTTGIGPCAQVSATPGQTQGAAGTIIGTITLAEVGSSGPCTTEGYPNLTRYSASGATVPTTVVNGLTVNLSGPPSQPAALVTLSSSQKAEFTFQYSDVVTGSETSCAVSSTLSVFTPGATRASSPVPLSISACNNGTVHVSPIYAATS